MKKKALILMLALAPLCGARAYHLQDNTGSFENVAKQTPAADAMTGESPANHIAAGKVVYSGVVVQIVKADHPLQLISPFAPKSYNADMDNVTVENNGKVTGLNFLSIRF